MRHLPFRKTKQPAKNPSSHVPLSTLHSFLNDFFDSPSALSKWEGASGEFNPKFEIKQNDKEVTVKAELPGVAKEDTHISLDDDVLTIRGEKKSSHEDDQENRYYSEVSYGYFERAFALPYHVDAEKVSAQFSNGVLEIHLEKMHDKEEKSRKIYIK